MPDEAGKSGVFWGQGYDTGCQWDWQCDWDAGLVCRDDGGGRSCLYRAGAGEVCDSDNDCGEWLACTGGVCASRIDELQAQIEQLEGAKAALLGVSNAICSVPFAQTYEEEWQEYIDRQYAEEMARRFNEEYGKVVIEAKKNPSGAREAIALLVGVNAADLTLQQISMLLAKADGLISGGKALSDFWLRLCAGTNDTMVGRAALGVIQKFFPQAVEMGEAMTTAANAIQQIAKVPGMVESAAKIVHVANVAVDAYMAVLAVCDVSKLYLAAMDWGIAGRGAEQAEIIYEQATDKYCDALLLESSLCQTRAASVDPVVEMIESDRCQGIAGDLGRERSAGACL